MRIFYAACFSPDTIRHLTRIQDLLLKNDVRGRYIPRENFHMTLHFIGETSVEKIPGLIEVLQEAFGAFRGFPLNVQGLGSFRQGKKELVYARMSDPQGELAGFSQRLRDLSGRGDGKPLKPHVTLVRNAMIPGVSRKMLFEQVFGFTAEPPASLALMESRQQGGGIVYVPLHETFL